MPDVYQPTRPTLVKQEIVLKETVIGEIASVGIGYDADAFTDDRRIDLAAGSTLYFGEGTSAQKPFLKEATIAPFNDRMVIVTGRIYGHPEVAPGSRISFNGAVSVTLTSGQTLKIEELLSINSNVHGSKSFRVQIAGAAPAPA